MSSDETPDNVTKITVCCDFVNGPATHFLTAFRSVRIGKMNKVDDVFASILEKYCVIAVK